MAHLGGILQMNDGSRLEFNGMCRDGLARSSFAGANPKTQLPKPKLAST